jgi:hypothetical protein
VFEPARLDPLFLDYSESEELKSFHLAYWINAANMPQHIERQLHVIFEPENQNNK